MTKLFRRFTIVAGAVIGLIVVASVVFFIALPYNPAPLSASVIHDRVDLIYEAAAITVPHTELDDNGSRQANLEVFQSAASGNPLSFEESSQYRKSYQAVLLHNQNYLARFDRNLTPMKDVRMEDSNNVRSFGIEGFHDHHDQSIRSNTADLVRELDRVRNSKNPITRVVNALLSYKDLTDVLLHAATVPETKSVPYIPPEKSPGTRIEVDIEYVLREFKEAQFQPVNSPEYKSHVHAALDRYDMVVKYVQSEIDAALGSVARTYVGNWGSWQSLGPDLEGRVAERMPRGCLPTVDESNGLSDCDRAAFYHTPEGSELIPLAWYRALKNAHTGRLFAEDYDRFGLIGDPNGPIGLAVGLSVSQQDVLGLKVVGVNCAACHTAEFRYNGQRYRVDGAPAMFDIARFLGELIDSLKATLASPSELTNFLVSLQTSSDIATFNAAMASGHFDTEFPAALSMFKGDKEGVQLGGIPASEIRESLVRIVAEEQAVIERELAQHPENLKHQTLARDEKLKQLALIYNVRERVDDVGPFSMHKEFSIEPSDPRLAKLRSATVDANSWWQLVRHEVHALIARIEFLKNLAIKTADADAGYGRLDAFGAARNLLFGEDFGVTGKTAPVSFPALWGFDNKAWLHWTANTNSVLERNMGQALGLGAVVLSDGVSSTIDVENLHQLELLARKIEPPKWPESLFQPIDRDKADEGRRVYDENCAVCHNKGHTLSNGLVNYPLFSIDRVGTDDLAARNFDAPVGDRPFYERSGAILARIKRAYFDAHPDSIDYEFGRDPVVWRSPLSDVATKPKVYPALPLDGIWARAPYLHNNSVASLRDLLLPGHERPAVVIVGSREYDPTTVGFSQEEIPDRTFAIDTGKPGNSNRGHEYGTSLNSEQKNSLLEYLKTL